MELYRFTGTLTGLILSGGISLFFFMVSKGTGAAAIDVRMFYLLIPPMMLFGFIFDTQAIWKRLMKLSKFLTPSYIGSGVFWTFAWPFCKLFNELLYSYLIKFEVGTFILPSHLTKMGFDGIIGFFIYQAVVGSGMGIMFFMVYTPVFSTLTSLKSKLGLEKIERYELTSEEEFAEFGLRK